MHLQNPVDVGQRNAHLFGDLGGLFRRRIHCGVWRNSIGAAFGMALGWY
jgi:hypothetical protein